MINCLFRKLKKIKITGDGMILQEDLYVNVNNWKYNRINILIIIATNICNDTHIYVKLKVHLNV